MTGPRLSNRSRFDGARAARPKTAPPTGHLPHVGPTLLDDVVLIAKAALVGGVAIFALLAILGWLP